MRNLQKLALGISIGTLSVTSHGEGLTFVPEVFLGVMDYEIQTNAGTSRFIGDRLDVADNSRNQKHSVTAPLIGLKLGAGQGDYFGSVYYQQTLSGTMDTKFKSATAQMADPSLDSNIADASDIDFDREDASITVGRRFGDNLSVYLGYKTGESEFEQKLLQAGPRSTREKLATSLEEDGPLIGINYGLPLGKGVLGFNLAYADLDAEFDFKFSNSTTGESIEQPLSGDADGFTYGVSWKGSINQQLQYGITLDAYSYSFTTDGDNKGGVIDNGANTPVTLGPIDASIDEEAVTFRVGLTYLL